MTRRKGLSGWLTKKDIEALEQASKKPEKEKNFVQKWKCSDCQYQWFYDSKKCPICSSPKFEKC